MRRVTVGIGIILITGITACGAEQAHEKMPVKTEIIDTGNIQDGTVKEKTLDIDTPETNLN